MLFAAVLPLALMLWAHGAGDAAPLAALRLCGERC
jgi:hypothetical protein